MTTPFRVGITADFRHGIPGRLEPVLAEVFDPLPYLQYEYFDFSGQDERGKQVAPQDIAGYDAILAFGVRFPAAAFAGASRPAVLSRWGVGYDMVDVPACTAANILLAITTDAVRRPVAEAIVTLLHALSMRLFDKDRLVRSGRWSERAAIPSVGLRGKTLGSLGLGNIGAELVRLLAPFGLARTLAFDPYARPERAAELGVELVDLPTLFREADFVTINCPLTDETRGLVNADLIALMKPAAYLINTARGPIVNQDDLVAALQAGRIAGAGLDVFATEPLPADHPLTRLDNVILTPHALAWNDELYHDTGVDACHNILTVLRGEIPAYTVNRAVVNQPGFQTKLALLPRALVAIDHAQRLEILKMKPNRFQQVVAEGGIPVGHMILEFGTRGMAQLLDQAGVDFVVIDTEHSGFTSAEIADQVAWFKATTIAPFVRIPQIEYHLIARTLDLGVLGLMVPNVRTGAEAKAIVEAAKYLPAGKRGVIMGNAHTDFKAVNPAEQMAYANRNTTIICQIESVEGLENIEAIATTPGVDVLWVGHFDLTNSQGIPGQFHHAQFLDAVKLVIDTCRKHGLRAGIQPGSLAQAEQWMGWGFDVISYSGDFFVYAEAMKSAVAGVRKLAGDAD